MDELNEEDERALKLSRRRLLAGGLAAAPALAALHEVVPHQGIHDALGGSQHPDALAAGGARLARVRRPLRARASRTLTSTASAPRAPTFRDGQTVDHKANGFNPTEILRDFDYGMTTRLASGRVLREWQL